MDYYYCQPVTGVGSTGTKWAVITLWVYMSLSNAGKARA